MKKEKQLTFSLKTRQKHKHMTTVCGLELFGGVSGGAVTSRCRYKSRHEGVRQEILLRRFCGEERGKYDGDYDSGRFGPRPRGGVQRVVRCGRSVSV